MCVNACAHARVCMRLSVPARERLLACCGTNQVFGFVECPELKAMFGRDTYVPQALRDKSWLVSMYIKAILSKGTTSSQYTYNLSACVLFRSFRDRQGPALRYRCRFDPQGPDLSGAWRRVCGKASVSVASVSQSTLTSLSACVCREQPRYCNRRVRSLRSTVQPGTGTKPVGSSASSRRRARSGRTPRARQGIAAQGLQPCHVKLNVRLNLDAQKGRRKPKARAQGLRTV